MRRAWLRRLVMVPAVTVLAVVLLTTAVVWIPVLVVVDLVRRRGRLPLARFTMFGLLWAWLEVWGAASAGLLWLVGRGSDQRANYRLQAWWTRGVVAALRVTVGLSIEVEGAPARGDGPFVALCRHASLADSVMSAWVFVTHSALRPRYVLKRELELDPCLDIVGHRLPNYFVDRRSANVAGELDGIAAMADGLSVGDIAVIFPEGTRANPTKRARMLGALSARSPARAERLAGLKHLLPPKPAGAAALLQAVPHARVLTMWHSGFDGMDTFGGILRQLGARAVKVHVRIVEHQRATIATGESFVAWLDQQWVAMDESVSHHLARLNLVPNKENTHG